MYKEYETDGGLKLISKFHLMGSKWRGQARGAGETFSFAKTKQK